MLVRIAILFTGIIACQFVLIGPSLMGWKVLLPLDLLELPETYIPMTARTANKAPLNFALSDLALQCEPARMFAVSEVQAGRLPQWTPNSYGGTLAMASKYSPYYLLMYLFRSPAVLAWIHIPVALAAGLGMYVFCRRTLGVDFWPATIVAWCYPMTGFFVFWEGHGLAFVVSWLPWLLLAVDAAVRQKSRFATPWLALATWLTIVSANIDIAAQVLLTSGLYAVWCLIDCYLVPAIRDVPEVKNDDVAEKNPKRPRVLRAGQRTQEPLFRIDWIGFAKSVASVSVGWGLGFLLAAPQLLPFIEYTRTGSRIIRRSSGQGEERPPIGLAALPEIVVPDIYGSTQSGSLPLFPRGQGNLLESASATYVGLLATLLFAPLAWCSRRHLSVNIFWTLLALFTLSWQLNVPGVVSFLRLPGMNMMSHNRFVFAASFAILAMAALGLNTLSQARLRRQWWFVVPPVVLLALCCWLVVRSIDLPEPLASQLGKIVAQGQAVAGISTIEQVSAVQNTFLRAYAVALLLCMISLLGWLLLFLQVDMRRWILPVAAGLLLADLIWFGYDRFPQSDPALYYPPIPALEQLAKSTPGRVIGYHCLPALLAQTHGLADIRGYDGTDPKLMIDLLGIAADAKSPQIPYAVTQWMIPKLGLTPTGQIRLHPIMDMLNVRYVIFRGNPPPGLQPSFRSPDYWVMTNPMAMPRVFVPNHVETVADEKQRLLKLADPSFDPRQVAYAELPLEVPAVCQGTAQIVEELPTRIKVSVDMATPGLLVLADRWDVGWKAYLDGRPVPLLRVNHALRGVAVPAKQAIVEFRYEPASLTLGLWLAGLALLTILIWIGWIVWRFRSLRGARLATDRVAA
jgi:hypothetical protein